MVVAIVGVRKLFDYFPGLFSQRELSWLDDVMPEKDRKVSLLLTMMSDLVFFNSNAANFS